MKIKVEIDGVVKYEHSGDFFSDDILNEVDLTNAAKYDLELYHLPPILRKILKTTKQFEGVHIRTTRKDKAAPLIDDPQGIFSKDLLSTF